jgi:hypothetical protein
LSPEIVSASSARSPSGGSRVAPHGGGGTPERHANSRDPPSSHVCSRCPPRHSRSPDRVGSEGTAPCGIRLRSCEGIPRAEAHTEAGAAEAAPARAPMRELSRADAPTVTPSAKCYVRWPGRAEAARAGSGRPVRFDVGAPGSAGRNAVRPRRMPRDRLARAEARMLRRYERGQPIRARHRPSHRGKGRCS